MPTGSGPWGSIDEGDARGFESGQLSDQVVRAICDVVQALPLALQEASDGGIGTEGLDQLDGPDERDPDAEGFERFGRGAGVTGSALVGMAARLDGVNGDADVVQTIHFRMLRTSEYSDKER